MPIPIHHTVPTYSPSDIIAGKYELRRKVAEGGMGEIWLAQNTALEVPVALKLLRVEGRSLCAPERLVLEARATAQLHHPAVVRVFDCGQTDHGDPYLVMELLEGESLRELLDREEKLSADRAVQLLLPILDGLSAAHAHGIVHRDLKPDNVFLAHEDGGRMQPKVLDFGVAKLVERSARKLVTRRGTVVGSPDYMSPEQARGQDIDARTDVWAMCVSLYETIAGFRPFFAKTQQGVMLAVISHEPIPLDERHGVDPELWGILARGLAKEREERFETMRDLGRALAQWLLSLGVQEDICAASLRATWLEDAEARAKRSVSSPGGVVVPMRRPVSDRPLGPAAFPAPTADAPLGRVSCAGSMSRFVAVPIVSGVSASRPVSVAPPSSPRRSMRGVAVLCAAVVLVALAGALHPSSVAAVSPGHPIVEPMTSTARTDGAATTSGARTADERLVSRDETVSFARVADPSSMSAPSATAATPERVRAPRKTVTRRPSGGGLKPRAIDFGF